MIKGLVVTTFFFSLSLSIFVDLQSECGAKHENSVKWWHQKWMTTEFNTIGVVWEGACQRDSSQNPDHKSTNAVMILTKAVHHTHLGKYNKRQYASSLINDIPFKLYNLELEKTKSRFLSDTINVKIYTLNSSFLI